MAVKIQIDSTDKILAKRKLNVNGAGQQFFTNECAKFANPYVPFKRGRLKDLMVDIKVDKIIYRAPYASKQYYTNTGNGIGGLNNNGLRGKLWIPRMWQDHGPVIVKKVAEFCGGKAE